MLDSDVPLGDAAGSEDSLTISRLFPKTGLVAMSLQTRGAVARGSLAQACVDCNGIVSKCVTRWQPCGLALGVVYTTQCGEYDSPALRRMTGRPRSCRRTDSSGGIWTRAYGSIPEPRRTRSSNASGATTLVCFNSNGRPPTPIQRASPAWFSA